MHFNPNSLTENHYWTHHSRPFPKHKYIFSENIHLLPCTLRPQNISGSKHLLPAVSLLSQYFCSCSTSFHHSHSLPFDSVFFGVLFLFLLDGVFVFFLKQNTLTSPITSPYEMNVLISTLLGQWRTF